MRDSTGPLNDDVRLRITIFEAILDAKVGVLQHVDWIWWSGLAMIVLQLIIATVPCVSYGDWGMLLVTLAGIFGPHHLYLTTIVFNTNPNDPGTVKNVVAAGSYFSNAVYDIKLREIKSFEDTKTIDTLMDLENASLELQRLSLNDISLEVGSASRGKELIAKCY